MAGSEPEVRSRRLSFEGEGADAPIAFQFEDVRLLAAKILKRATDQANRKIEAANKQATQIEQAAYDDGFKKGHAEGYAKGEAEGRAAGEAAAREEFRERTRSVAESLEQVVHELRERHAALCSQAEADLVGLAMAIARRVVRREIALDERFVLEQARAAIALAGERSDLVLHLHPLDLEVVEAELPSLHAAFASLEKVSLQPDEELERGEVRLRGRETEIDLRLAEQFAALERALLGDAGRGRGAEDGHGSKGADSG